MKRRSFGLFVVAALLAVWTVPAGAIANGEPSADDRVGALFATVLIPNPEPIGPEYIEDGPFIVCSGSQASESVFLTAGHCLAWTQGLPPGFGVKWSVTLDDLAFDPDTFDADPGATLLEATEAVFDPGFGHDLGNLKDYGVVLFDGDDTLPGPYVDLPYLGQLDDMKRSHSLKGFLFDRVGYGTHPEFKQGPPRFSDDGLRYEAMTPYKALNTNMLRLHENEDKTGLGGGCFGDSGSPILGSDASGYANVAFAVTSGGDPICRSDAWNQRLDTPDAQAFLEPFIDLPSAP